MIYLIILVSFVFLLFWLGDLYLTIKTVKHLGTSVELNPIIKFLLKGRGKLIYIIKPLELILFFYLIWVLTTFEGFLSFSILLIFIFIYSIVVVNNAHVFFKATKKESVAFKFIFVFLTIFTLFFIYLNFLLYQDIGVSYTALEESNDKYVKLYWDCKGENISLTNTTTNSVDNLPILNLPIRRSVIK